MDECTRLADRGEETLTSIRNRSLHKKIWNILNFFDNEYQIYETLRFKMGQYTMLQACNQVSITRVRKEHEELRDILLELATIFRVLSRRDGFMLEQAKDWELTYLTVEEEITARHKRLSQLWKKTHPWAKRPGRPYWAYETL